MSMRLVRSEEDAPLPQTGTITPQQKALYEEARKIFGNSGANRPDVPGRPVAEKAPSKLGRARFASIAARFALERSRGMLPKYRDDMLRRHGLDPKAFPDDSAAGNMKLVTDEEA